MFYSDLTFCISFSVSWKSTDGLIIYFGRNGIDMKEKTKNHVNYNGPLSVFTTLSLRGFRDPEMRGSALCV
jgi:hypothetical protein